MSVLSKLNMLYYDNGDVEIYFEDYLHGHDSAWMLNNDVEGSVTRLYTYATEEEARLTADEFVQELKALMRWIAAREGRA